LCRTDSVPLTNLIRRRMGTLNADGDEPGRNRWRAGGKRDAPCPLSGGPASPIVACLSLSHHLHALGRREKQRFANPLRDVRRRVVDRRSEYLRTTGMLNGVLGSVWEGPACCNVAGGQGSRSLGRGRGNGTIVQRVRERFTKELTLVFASGETAMLRLRPPHPVLASGETAILRDRFRHTDLRHER